MKARNMKRQGKLWTEMLSIENGLVAMMEGTAKKRRDPAVQRYLYTTEEIKEYPSAAGQINLVKAKPFIEEIITELRKGIYRHAGPYRKIIISRNKTESAKPKIREVYVPTFRDHILHHMVIQICRKAFYKGMHPHCCGSVEHRGQKHVVRTASRWFRKDKQCRYFVKLDIQKFFPSIPKDKLMETFRRKIKDKYVLSVLEQIINSAPVACPIGYYTSPIFANLYLQDFDWYVEQQLFKERRGKRIKYVRHYMRYMDDMLLIGTSKTDLYKAVKMIKKYLAGLDLKIKDTWEIKKIGSHEFINDRWKLKPDTYWCDFIGFKFCQDATILRNGIFLGTARLVRKMAATGYYTLHQCQSINARAAWAAMADDGTLLRKYINPYIDIKETRRIISKCSRKAKTETM